MAIRLIKGGAAKNPAVSSKSSNAEPETPLFRSPADLKAYIQAEALVKKAGIGRVIATRILAEKENTGHRVTLKIGEPRQILPDDNWLCPYSIEGIIDGKLQFAPGVDALQSLILALEGIRCRLREAGGDFTWLGDGPGIPLPIPDFGKTFDRRIEQIVNQQKKRVQLRELGFRKKQLELAEKKLNALKRKATRQREPDFKAALKAAIAEQEGKMKFNRRVIADWEANLEKWKP